MHVVIIFSEKLDLLLKFLTDPWSLPLRDAGLVNWHKTSLSPSSSFFLDKNFKRSLGVVFLWLAAVSYLSLFSSFAFSLTKYLRLSLRWDGFFNFKSALSAWFILGCLMLFLTFNTVLLSFKNICFLKFFHFTFVVLVFTIYSCVPFHYFYIYTYPYSKSLTPHIGSLLGG